MAQGELAGAGPDDRAARRAGSCRIDPAIWLADSCRVGVGIRLAVAISASYENAMVLVSGLARKVFRINRSIARRDRLGAGVARSWLLTICYGLAERGETATVRQELAGCESG